MPNRDESSRVTGPLGSAKLHLALQAPGTQAWNRGVLYSPLAWLGLAHGEHSSQVERLGLEYFRSSGNIVLARFPRVRSN